MRFESVGLAGILVALGLSSGCGGDSTSLGTASASNGCGSGNGGATQTGGAATGGRAAGGGAPSSNGGRSGGPGAGGSSGGTNTGGEIGDASVGAASGAGGGAGATGGVGGSATGGTPSSGGAPADAAANVCGSEPCSSTRCAAWNCGAAVCCTLQSRPICVHGTTSCPAADGGGDSATLACWGGAKNAYVFAKACTQKSDCFVAENWVGCCNVQAVGLRTSEKSRFDSFEASCGGAPACGCCCDRVTAEDGTVVSAGTALGVDCVAGLCKSTAP